MGSFPNVEQSIFDLERRVPIKTESSPDLIPAGYSSLKQYNHLSFSGSHRHPSHAPHPLSRQPSPQPSPSLFRFGTGHLSPTFHAMSGNHWASGPGPHHQTTPQGSRNSISNQGRYESIPNLPYTMSFSDEGEDASDFMETRHDSFTRLSESDAASGERLIRRRSSKACDQCRKSKCKCERTSPNESCRNCVLLGTECTFLGPSRKRGPPKGYIDAIEARLHQMEALLGVIMSCDDDRATSLLQDISQDSLAKEIINRVDQSSYGVKGRERGQNSGKGKHAQNKGSGNTHPSNEWQDRVTEMLRRKKKTSSGRLEAPRNPSIEVSDERGPPKKKSRRSISSAQRRRLEGGTSDISDPETSRHYASTSSLPISDRPRSSRSPFQFSNSPLTSGTRSPLHSDTRSPVDSIGENHVSTRKLYNSDGYNSDDEDDLPHAIGQLSLNEDEQVRYHGKASGLYLLGADDRIDERNAGGIWRFPTARVWPPISPSSSPIVPNTDPITSLPPPDVQEELLDLYFTHVHPILPVIHKQSFFANLRAFPPASRTLSPRQAPVTTVGLDTRTPSPYNSRRRRVPPLLLFSMFAIAARYSNPPHHPSSAGLGSSEASPMWDAGDQYLATAQRLLDRSYASSRPETCQALLLLGYREIGIGAMAEAWTYAGMAIRMAQDLGMHRRADGWARAELGGILFGDWELQERRRIWFSCVIMDKYVSSYIGRPLMIFEHDFDTLLPDEDSPDEIEELAPYRDNESEKRIPGRIISCFNASAVLSGIAGTVIQSIYAVRPARSRREELISLEGRLDKWLHGLPEHLQYDPSPSRPVPPPHILTLHMQYWCVVLMLHRPFIRTFQSKNRTGSDTHEIDGDIQISQRHYELSMGAANRITSIAALYLDKYSCKASPPYHCYYVFTASIMHVTALSVFPSDPQARVGLNTCMEVLRAIEVVWPSAGRALELLRGSKVNSVNDLPVIQLATDRRKRPFVKISQETSFPQSPFTSETVPSAYSNPYSPDNDFQPTLPPIQTGSSSGNYYRMDQRWAPEHHFDNVQYSGSLTTAVLPQSYSTGFVDDRTTLHEDQHSHVSPTVSQHPHRGYPPQYWDDYSAYPPLNAQNSYGHVSQHPQQHPSPSSVPHTPTSHIFLQPPYQYNNSAQQ